MPADEEPTLESLPHVCRFCGFQWAREQGLVSHLVEIHYRRDVGLYDAMLKAEKDRDTLRAELAAMTADRDEARTEIERLTAAGIEPSAERALVPSAEAYRLVEEARQMRDERDAARAEVATARIETLWALQPYLMHMGCDSFASLPDPDCSCGLRGKVGAIRALSSQPGDRRAGDRSE